MKWVMKNLFHGGHYEYCYSHICRKASPSGGMGCHNPELFSCLYSTDSSDFHQSDCRLDSVHHTPNHHRYSAVCRTKKQASARCLSSPVCKIPLAACFYASLAGCSLPHTHIISRMRRDAAIYALPRKKPKHQRGPKPKKGERLGTPTQIASRVKTWRYVKTWQRGKTKCRLVYSKLVIWYKVSHCPVLLVISRDPAGKEKDDFFFTTDLNLMPAEVIGGFAGRLRRVLWRKRIIVMFGNHILIANEFVRLGGDDFKVLR